jgi:hypothetical protein
MFDGPVRRLTRRPSSEHPASTLGHAVAAPALCTCGQRITWPQEHARLNTSRGLLVTPPSYRIVLRHVAVLVKVDTCSPIRSATATSFDGTVGLYDGSGRLMRWWVTSRRRDCSHGHPPRARLGASHHELTIDTAVIDRHEDARHGYGHHRRPSPPRVSQAPGPAKCSSLPARRSLVSRTYPGGTGRLHSGLPLGEAVPNSCSHLDQIDLEARPSADGCEDCLRTGGWWVHLRMCRKCGHVGCCDSSPARHAKAHYSSVGHPLVSSYEPGEDWWWCFEDELMFTIPDQLTYAHS